MTVTAIVISIIIGLAVNESCELSPWIARKVVRWSAHHRYADPARAEARAEELCSLIDDRPGKLFKLFTAFSFAIATITVLARRPQEHSTRLRANLTPIQLTPQQVKAVHDESIRHALTLGMSHEKAELMADAVVGALIDTD